MRPPLQAPEGTLLYGTGTAGLRVQRHPAGSAARTPPLQKATAGTPTLQFAGHSPALQQEAATSRFCRGLFF